MRFPTLAPPTARYRLGIWLLGAFAICAPAARADAQLATIETPEVRLVYFDGSETYLVPHAARAFLNALGFEADLFKFKPADPITVLLDRLLRRGQRGRGAVPRDS